MPTRTKSVTDPLDDRVKARLIQPDSAAGEGYASSSGSEHEGLSGVLRIDGFFFDDSQDEGGCREEDDDGGAWSDEDKEDDDNHTINGAVNTRPSSVAEPSSSSPFSSLSRHSAAVIRDMMRASASAAAKDPFRRDLLAVITAAQLISQPQPGMSAFRRAVMCALRDAGYNAAVCKSRWGGTSGVTAGTYEYIDVVRPGASSPLDRYIVDLAFAAEFEIARPTDEYARLAAELPAVYVARPDELRPVLRVLADAAKRSLRQRGMHVPPWRKLRYVLAKWLGPYKRTTNADPPPASSSASNAAAAFPRLTATATVHCRAVGFQQPARFPVAPPPMGRTR